MLSGQAPAEIHFQPIVDLRAGTVAGYEALARFPAAVALPPNIWFERAARLGKGSVLQRMMVRKALEARSALPANCFLTINAGPEFLASPEWQEVLSDSGDLAGVVIEITEESPVQNYEALRTYLSQIRRKGGTVAVDDAGAGYASLSHVLEIRPDFIKIDRRFVQNCSFDRARSTLVEMVGAAASRLDAWIIAEGVEMAAELEELLRLSVPLAQGYLLGRPAPRMAVLEPGLRQLLRGQALHSGAPSLAQHLTSAPSFRTAEAAQQALQASGEMRDAVLVDRWSRPVELVQRHPLVGIRRLSEFLRAHISSNPAEVLDRALTRDEALRFDPVVVIGEEGEYLGVAGVDRLAAALLHRPRPHPARRAGGE